MFGISAEVKLFGIFAEVKLFGISAEVKLFGIFRCSTEQIYGQRTLIILSSMLIIEMNAARSDFHRTCMIKIVIALWL